MQKVEALLSLFKVFFSPQNTEFWISFYGLNKRSNHLDRRMFLMEPALSLRLVGHKKCEGDRKAKGRSSMRGFSTISGSYNKEYEFRERVFQSNFARRPVFRSRNPEGP